MKKENKLRISIICELLVCILSIATFLTQPYLLIKGLALFVAMASICTAFDNKRELDDE